MHSEKIMKVLGAGLTAAALTLGAAVPALANVTVGGATIDAETDVKKAGTVDATSTDDTLYLEIDLTSDSDKKAGVYANAEFAVTTTSGDQQRFTLADMTGVGAPTYFDADGNEITLGSKYAESDVARVRVAIPGTAFATYANGNYSVTKVEAVDSDMEDPAPSLETSGLTFKVTGSNVVASEPEIDVDSIGLDTYTYSSGDVVEGVYVSVSGTAEDAEISTVTFTYLAPDGTEVTADAEYYEDDEDEAYYQAWYAELDSTDFWQNGSYTLVSIEATDEDGNYTLVTSADEDLSAGDFEREGGFNAIMRVYNPNSGEHFYTASAGERDALVEAGWKDEGTAWMAPDKDMDDAVEVFRVYNPNGGDHHFTMSEGERDLLVAAGWRNEGVAFYSMGSTKSSGSYVGGTFTYPNTRIYRVYNPNAATGSHHYTTSAGEKDLLVAAGWNDEGTGWFAVDTETEWWY